MVNSKQKGGGYEREICVALSKWITNGQKIDCLWRSAMSGGRATVKRGQVRQAGDICAVAPEGHALTDSFYIECKSYKDLSLDCLVKGKGTLIDFWNTAVTEAVYYKKLPMLIYKQNRAPSVVCLSERGIEELNLQLDVFLQTPSIRFVRFDDMVSTKFPLK